MEFNSKTEEETRQLGKRLILDFLEAEKNRKNALVISLEGDLGAGKTTFTQGIAQGLGIQDWIKSPTFIIMRELAIPSENRQRTSISFLYHIDCYRIDDSTALIEIGIRDILKDKNNLVVVEWGEKIKNILPPQTINIKFGSPEKTLRKIKVV